MLREVKLVVGTCDPTPLETTIATTTPLTVYVPGLHETVGLGSLFLWGDTLNAVLTRTGGELARDG